LYGTTVDPSQFPWMQTLPDTKKSGMVVELQKLVNEWPMAIVKHQKEENRKVQYFLIFCAFILKGQVTHTRAHTCFSCSMRIGILVYPACPCYYLINQALAAVLKSGIPAMVNGLPNMGVEAKVNLEDLAIKEEIPC
jgi:hypothetical protein